MMPLDRRIRVGAVLLAMVNLVPALQADEGWGILALVVSAAMLSFLLARRDGSTRVPTFLQVTLVFASLSYLVFEMFLSGDRVYILHLSHFLTFLCACKFFDLRTNRDIGLVAIIAFLVLSIGALVSGSIVFALAVMIDVTAGTAWLMAFHLKRETDAIRERRLAGFGLALPGDSRKTRTPARRRASAAGAVAARSAEPAAWTATDSGRLLIADIESVRRERWRLPRALGAATTGMMVTGIILFVGVPRGIGRSLFGSFQRSLPRPITGFTDTVELHDLRITESNEPVMRVRLTRGGGPFGGVDYEPYMRGTTMTRYREGSWHRRPLPEVPRDLLPNRGLILSEARSQVPDPEMIRQDVWLDHVEQFLFAIYPPLEFASRDIDQIQLDKLDRSVAAKQGGGSSAQYTVYSPFRISPDLTASLDKDFTDLRNWRGAPSDISPRIGQLASELATRFGDYRRPADHARIVAGLKSYLADGEFSYSLDPGGQRPQGVDPVEYFLFQRKRGHCEYFASALALMCQSLGIRARLVAGYAGGEFNETGNFYQFRQKHAHAWVEVYLPGRGWTIFDPSPSRDANIGGAQTGVLASLRRMTEFLQFKWSVFVVAFDSEARGELVGRFGAWFVALFEEAHGAGAPLESTWNLIWGPEFLSNWMRVAYWFFLLLCVIFLALLGRIAWIISLMIREYLPRKKRPGATIVRAPEARFYDRMLVLLAAKGHRKKLHQTPREFANGVAQVVPALGEARQVTEWFYQAQYGGGPLDTDQRLRTSEFLRRLREDAAFGARRSVDAVSTAG